MASMLSQASQIIAAYDLFLIDAYGVLITSSGALPGAREFLQEIKRQNKTFFILTNDASKTPENAAAFYGKNGLDIEVHEILSAGLAIGPALASRNLTAPHCAVLGTADTIELVRRAGAKIVDLTQGGRAEALDAVIIGDDSGFETLPMLNAVLSSIHQAVVENRTPHLLLANPDLLYPKGHGHFGFTSGSLAALLEMGLKHLHPHLTWQFDILGKPGPWLFEEALRRSKIERSRTVMLGDQIATDISGANRVGIASTLVTTGLTTWPPRVATGATPKHVLNDLLVK